MTRDTWGGDANSPISYNAWLYADGNATNLIDPSGQYGEEVHYALTLAEANRIGRMTCHGLVCALVESIAVTIANGDENVDKGILMPMPGGAPELHFRDLPEAQTIAGIAVALGEPYLVGGSLHMIQDWFSHYSEGYRWPGTLGHTADTLAAGCVPFLGCDRGTLLTRAFYRGHPSAKIQLSLAYPGVNLNNISDDKLIDLYLYTFTNPGDVERGPIGYGYDTDHFFGFTNRDRGMIKALI
jgi:hypothetical protein